MVSFARPDKRRLVVILTRKSPLISFETTIAPITTTIATCPVVLTEATACRTMRNQSLSRSNRQKRKDCGVITALSVNEWRISPRADVRFGIVTKRQN
jgi:hypothetical protein